MDYLCDAARYSHVAVFAAFFAEYSGTSAGKQEISEYAERRHGVFQKDAYAYQGLPQLPLPQMSVVPGNTASACKERKAYDEMPEMRQEVRGEDISGAVKCAGKSFFNKK